MAITAAFSFSLLLFNLNDGTIHDVKADFLSKTDKIDVKIDILNDKTEKILISQARIETKIDSLTP